MQPKLEMRKPPDADERLREAVLLLLAGQACDAPPDDLDVAVLDFVVILQGTVSTHVDRLRCAAIAGSHPLCRGVVNFLEVEAEAGLTDQQITSSIRQALKQHPGLDARTVVIRTTGGTVHLSGTVPATPQADTIAEIVHLAPGVRHLQNELVADRSAHEALLAKWEQIQGQLSQAPGLEDQVFEVSCSRDLAVLSGRVQCSWQSNMARAIVTSMTPCHNDLVVSEGVQ